MHRFFVGAENLAGGKVSFSPSDYEHMAMVLRLRPGETVTAVLPPDREYLVSLVQVGKQSCWGTVHGERTVDREPPVAVTLYQGVLKGEKMDTVVAAATELGVGRIIPVFFARSVPTRQSQGKDLRLNRIVREAAALSGRTIIPTVEGAISWDDALGLLKGHERVFLLWEEEKGRGLIGELGGQVRNASVIIGPEGGITPAEAAGAIGVGAVAVTLGPRILRAQHAGLVALSLIMGAWGGLGG